MWFLFDRHPFRIEYCPDCHKTVCFWIVRFEEHEFLVCTGNRWLKRDGCGHRK